MIQIYNIAALILSLGITAAALIYMIRKRQQELHVPAFYAAGTVIFAGIGIFLRFYKLGLYPYGLQQDEASIGYDAFCLANYGIDRNGYPNPVYPITWGSGGGSPMLIWMNTLTTRLFGVHPFSIRIIPAVFGALTLCLFIFYLFRLCGIRAAFFGAMVFASAPWHIILSRWSLDSNIMPFWEILILILYTEALRKPAGNSFLLYSAAVLSGISLYSYGSATGVVPLFLIFTSIYSLVRRRVRFSQVVISVVLFALVSAPLAAFYLINFLHLPEIRTAWLSIPALTSQHSSVFLNPSSALLPQLRHNLMDLLRNLTIGELSEDALWNYVPGYGSLYRFTFPVSLGIGVPVLLYRVFGGKDSEKQRCLTHLSEDTAGRGQADFLPSAADIRASYAPLLFMLLASILFCLLIRQDTNRSVFLYLPLLVCLALGLDKIAECRTSLGIAASAFLLAGLILFARDYFGSYYENLAGANFMPGYGDAIQYAYNLRQAMLEDKGHFASAALPADSAAAGSAPAIPIYSTYESVASPYMSALYYCAYDP
ncbi:MAG: glycosyltransferase family 39 protein, partial [Eubacterium sp.]|nr:glycosyltransferase family 39 protein [Eubacterium sp.]